MEGVAAAAMARGLELATIGCQAYLQATLKQQRRAAVHVSRRGAKCQTQLLITEPRAPGAGHVFHIPCSFCSVGVPQAYLLAALVRF